MHERLRRSIALLVVLTVTAPGLLGCGGGNGGEDPGPGFQGLYHYVMLERDFTGDSILSETGQVTVDGAGMLTVTAKYASEEGTTTMSGAAAPSAYTVEADRRFLIEGGLVGRVSADGDVANATQRNDGSDPLSLLLTRRAENPTVAELAGSWHRIQFYRNGAAVGDMTGTVSTFEILADGTTDIDGYNYNRDGMVNPMPLAISLKKVAVEPGGWVAVTSADGSTVYWRGGASADRNLILLGTIEFTNNKAGIAVLVRKGQVTSTAALTGAYEVAGMENPGATFSSIFGAVDFDGSGSGSWQLFGTTGPAVVGPAPVGLTYTVTADGQADVSAAAIADWRGGVGGGGDYVVVGGSLLNPSSPAIHMFVR